MVVADSRPLRHVLPLLSAARAKSNKAETVTRQIDRNQIELTQIHPASGDFRLFAEHNYQRMSQGPVSTVESRPLDSFSRRDLGRRL